MFWYFFNLSSSVILFIVCHALNFGFLRVIPNGAEAIDATVQNAVSGGDNGGHRIRKRQIWSNDSVITDPEVIIPTCPCIMENDLCQDYDYCYCQLGYPLPLSGITGEPFLKAYFDQCSLDTSNESKLPNFNSLSNIEKYFAVSRALDWDCQERQDLLYQPQSLYPYLCVQKKRLPIKGTFYDIPSSLVLETHKTEAHYSLNSKMTTNFWKAPDNIQRLADLAQKRRIATVHAEKDTEKDSIDVENGDSFSISGPRACFEKAGVYRRHSASHYVCNIHLNVLQDEKITCDRIGSVLDAAAHHLLKLQLSPIFNLTLNGTITFAPSTRDEEFKTRIAQRTVPTSNPPKTDSDNSKSQVCSHKLIGLHFKFIHYRINLLKAKLTKQMGTQKKSTLLSITLSFEAKDANPKYLSKLSRFWYEFYNAICEDDSCWREMFQISLEEDFDFLASALIGSTIPLMGLIIVLQF